MDFGFKARFYDFILLCHDFTEKGQRVYRSRAVLYKQVAGGQGGVKWKNAKQWRKYAFRFPPIPKPY